MTSSKFIILNSSLNRLEEHCGKLVEYKVVDGKAYIKIPGLYSDFVPAYITWEELLSIGRVLTKLDKALR